MKEGLTAEKFMVYTIATKIQQNLILQGRIIGIRVKDMHSDGKKTTIAVSAPNMDRDIVITVE